MNARFSVEFSGELPDLLKIGDELAIRGQLREVRKFRTPGAREPEAVSATRGAETS